MNMKSQLRRIAAILCALILTCNFVLNQSNLLIVHAADAESENQQVNSDKQEGKDSGSESDKTESKKEEKTEETTPSDKKEEAAPEKTTEAKDSQDNKEEGTTQGSEKKAPEENTADKANPEENTSEETTEAEKKEFKVTAAANTAEDAKGHVIVKVGDDQYDTAAGAVNVTVKEDTIIKVTFERSNVAVDIEKTEINGGTVTATDGGAAIVTKTVKVTGDVKISAIFSAKEIELKEGTDYKIDKNEVSFYTTETYDFNEYSTDGGDTWKSVAENKKVTLDDDNYTIQMRHTSTDPKKVYTSSQETIIIDTTGPVIDVKQPDKWFGPDDTLSLTVTDKSDIQKVEYYVGDKDGERKTLSGPEYVLSADAILEGTNDYYFIATDEHGNEGNIVKVTIQKDTKVPVISEPQIKKTAEGALESISSKEWYGEGAQLVVTVENYADIASGVKVYNGEDQLTEDGKNPGQFLVSMKAGENVNYSFTAKSGSGVETSEAVTANVSYDIKKPENSVTAKVYLELKDNSEEEVTSLLEEENVDEDGLFIKYVNKEKYDKIESIKIELFAKDLPEGEETVSGVKDINSKLGEFKFENAVEINGKLNYKFVLNERIDAKKFDEFGIESVIDAAGNEQTEIAVKPEYGTARVVDIVAPEVNVTYELNGLVENKDGNTYYYGLGKKWDMSKEKKPEVDNPKLTPKFSITEEDSFTEKGVFESSPNGNWTGKEYEMSPLVPSEEAQQITFGYKDKAGNPMAGSSDYGSIDIDKGLFTSKDIVIDTTFPEITEFTIDGGIDYGDSEVYIAGDKAITFKVNDTNLDSVEITANDKDISSLLEEKKGTYSLKTAKIDSEKNKELGEGKYKFKVLATDKAGNSTLYTYEKTVIVDATPPELSIVYKWNNETHSGTIVDNKVYTYTAAIEYTIKDANPIPVIKENVKNEKNNVKIVEYAFPEGASVDEVKVLKDDGTELVYSANLDTDGINGNSTISCTDIAGNPMQVGTEETVNSNGKENTDIKGSFKDGSYTSPTFIIDQTKPEISVKLNDDECDPKNNRKYYNVSPTLLISVNDSYFHDGSKHHADNKDKIAYTTYDFDTEKDDKNDEKNHCWNNWSDEDTITTTIEKQYNYTIGKFSLYDLAGNKSEDYPEIQFTYDNTEPSMQVEGFYKDSYCKKPLDDEDTIEYNDWQKFHEANIYAKIEVTDQVSGVKSANVNTLVQTTETRNTNKGNKTESKEWPEPSGKQSYVITIDKNHLVKFLNGNAFDFSGNKGEADNLANSVMETQKYHLAHSSISINTSTSPSNTYKGLHYYNKNVSFTVNMEDKHSGLNKYEVTVDGKQDSKKQTWTHSYEDNAEGHNTKTKDSLSKTLQAGPGIYYSSGEHPTEVNAWFECNVGHKRKAQTEKYVIDNVKPVIKVDWTPKEGMNKKYYRTTRTAHITVTERNFYEQGVNWKIKNRNAGVHIGGWSHNGDTHTCNVDFTTDGDDFVLDFDITDLATNKTNCPPQEPFTIDKTAPKIYITFDNNNVTNGYYFNKARTATLHVDEHNFQASDVKYELSARDDGRAFASPTAGGWSMGSDHHTAAINYSKDGEYSLNFNYTDMAGNPANKIQTEKFVIDQTKPVVEIFDVKDHTAYNKEIAPGVRYSDTNLDEDQLTLRMVGNKVGLTDYSRHQAAAVHNGKEIKWDDFQRVQKVDDIYTFEVVLKDKAGNQNDPAKVTFSVNRFGSNYIFGDATAELLAKDHPYTNQEIPIEVTEINVSSLKEKSVSVQDGNNNITDLAENTDYTVTAGSDKYQWKEYKYVINSSNFEQEGRYTVTLASKDEAKNSMTNETKKKDIRFVIDKTKPTGVISGLDKGEYTKDKQDFTVTATDNEGLKEAVISVDGKKLGTFTEEDFAGKGVTQSLDSSNRRQQVKVALVDWAGNEKTVKSDDILVTSNLFWQWYGRKPLFYGSISGVTVAALGIIGYLTRGFGYAASMAAGSGFWWLIFGKKDDDDDEEQS